MFVSFGQKFSGQWKSIRYQCSCGKEYVPVAPNPACPDCGRLVPRMVSADDAAWIPHHQWRIQCLRRMLDPSALDEMPAEYREPTRISLTRQIRQLEDGSWKAEYKSRIQLLRRTTQHSEKWPELPAPEREKAQASMAAHLKALQEELEAAGETLTENIPPTQQYWTGKFIRPIITTREWDEDPMLVVQKVSTAIALHIQPAHMTPLQRRLVHLWHYFHAVSPGGGGHGEIFYNATLDDDQARLLREAIQSVCTLDHLTVFQKAEDQWHAKPRHYPQPPSGDRTLHAAWIQQTLRPMQEEFRAIDQEALRVQPSLESCITTLLHQHREELVEIVGNL